MKKLVASLIVLISICACVPAFAQNSQVYWHDRAQKQARKLQKQQLKAYNRSLKQQRKMMKREQKQARKDAKATHYPRDITRH